MSSRALKPLQPFLGKWTARAPGYTCTRELTPVLGGKYLQLIVHWDMGARQFEELAVYGVDPKDKRLKFWSFTSDGKRTEGKLVATRGLPPEAVSFEARVSAGLARMSLIPTEEGFTATIEAKPKGAKGWKRFLEQRFTKRGAG